MLSIAEFQSLLESNRFNAPPKDVLNLISSMASEIEIYSDPWNEIIKKQDTKTLLLGLRVYFKDKMIRINWESSATSPKSIDIWDDNIEGNKPPIYTLFATYEELLISTKMIVELVEDICAQQSNKKRINESILLDDGNLNLKPAPPEETSDPTDSSNILEMDSDEITIFSDLQDLVNMVIKGLNPALLVAGRGGVGKTYTVKKTLEDYGYTEGDEFVIVKGAATPLSLYKELYNHRDRILIFDDCDSIFRDEDALNILKAALDSEPERRISWLSRSTYDPESQKPTENKSVPNNFLFTGSVIFITNKDLSFFRSEKLEAVLSRAFPIEISLTSEQMLKLMDRNLADILPQEKMDIKREVLEYLKSDYTKKVESPISMRTLIKAIKIRISQAPNWKDLVLRYS